MKKILGVTFVELLWILLGTASLGAGVAWYADPFGLVIGGITGSSILISAVFSSVFGFGLSLGLLNFLLNIPIFIISWIQNGFRFIKKSLIGMLLLSLWLWVFEVVQNPFSVGDDIFMGSLLCGVLSGIGLALVLRTGATTGGTDMLAACIHKAFPHISFSLVIFVVDAIIIFLGIFIFGTIVTAYAVLSVFVTAKLIDAVSSGMRFGRAVFILSEKTDEISKQIFEQLGRGNTAIPVRGMYSGKERTMLYVVVRPKEVPRLNHLILQEDKHAFITVCNAQEVLGEGFLEREDSYIF